MNDQSKNEIFNMITNFRSLFLKLAKNSLDTLIIRKLFNHS